MRARRHLVTSDISHLYQRRECSSNVLVEKLAFKNHSFGFHTPYNFVTGNQTIMLYTSN